VAAQRADVARHCPAGESPEQDRGTLSSQQPASLTDGSDQQAP